MSREGKGNKPPPGSPGWGWEGGVLWSLRTALSLTPQGLGFSSRRCLTWHLDLFPNFPIRSQTPREPRGFAVFSQSPSPLLFSGSLCLEKQMMPSGADGIGGLVLQPAYCFWVVPEEPFKKYTFLGPTRDIMSQTLWRWGPGILFSTQAVPLMCLSSRMESHWCHSSSRRVWHLAFPSVFWALVPA